MGFGGENCSRRDWSRRPGVKSNPVRSNPSNPIPHSHSNHETSLFYFEWSPWQSFRHFWHSIWNSISPGWWLTYPSEKSWTNRQLGWWHSIPNWMESHIAAMFQTTNQPHFLASFLASIQGDEEEGVAPFLKPRDPYLAVPRWGNMGK